jgi:protoporphyrinogen oxidase
MKIKIVGFGFSGMACAYAAVKKGWQVEVYDKSPTPGGIIQTKHLSNGLVETAANGIICSSRVEELFSDLGIELVKANKQKSKRFVFVGKPQRWPLSFKTTIKLILKVVSTVLRIKVAKNLNEKLNATGISTKTPDHLTLEEWAHQWLGVDAGKEFVDRLLSPALGGIYAVSASELDARLVLTSALTRKSKKANVRGTVAPKNGMGELFQKFIPYLSSKSAVVFMNRELDINEFADSPVVIATSMEKAANLIEPFAVEFSNALKKVESQDLVSATLFFKSDQQQLEGFGCLFPEQEQFFSRGVLFNTDIFENRGEQRSETYIATGADKLKHSDDEFVKKVLVDRSRLMPHLKNHEPLEFSVSRWKGAIPIYSQHLRLALSKLSLPQNIYLTGNYLGYLSLSKILDQSFVLIDKIEQDFAFRNNKKVSK